MASPGTQQGAELLAAMNINPTTPKPKPLTPQQLAAKEFRLSTKKRKQEADLQANIAGKALAAAEAVSASPAYRIWRVSEAKKARDERKQATEAAVKEVAVHAMVMHLPASPAAQAKKRGGRESASKAKKPKKKQKPEQAPAQFEIASNAGSDTSEQSAVLTPK